ncbi:MULTISPECIES: hypothetical protein [Cutibacterium]|jgi:Ni/Co efflux regulator RcnB|nr:MULTISPECIES: hypothetical protein [Cutibacterium]AER06414.1 hypothetical protein TIIST44_09780 [Cutibacterium acnes subsp. defendens ATCC 11828]MDF2243408.1 hypothetical protein [Cutibacterium acnes subsp. defendens]MDF2262811.1 hypothetical protein [Cutibacterium acnes subsp. defendens]
MRSTKLRRLVLAVVAAAATALPMTMVASTSWATRESLPITPAT